MKRASLDVLRRAALDTEPVRGLTHNFYRYPARFSPNFARAAIENFSRRGDLVLDPFMGGGTTLLEAYASGRRAYGVDLNELSTFVARAKLTLLSDGEIRQATSWLERHIGSFSFAARLEGKTEGIIPKIRNLQEPRARPIKKLLAHVLHNIDGLESARTRRFVRCVLLRVSQWALDGRRQTPSLPQYRAQAFAFAEEMLCSIVEYRALVSSHPGRVYRPVVKNARAEDVAGLPGFREGEKADLVVTSPPYPGIHMLYHRWQIGGRRETPAPYWITASQDGKGASFYNFGNRHDPEQRDYFASYSESLTAIRSVMKRGAFLVQMVACRNPDEQLKGITDVLDAAGFRAVGAGPSAMSRSVPRRKWHAALKGETPAAREFVLLHEAK